MRAVVEHHSPDAESLPPIEILVVMGNEDLTIKVRGLRISSYFFFRFQNRDYYLFFLLVDA